MDENDRGYQRYLDEQRRQEERDALYESRQEAGRGKQVLRQLGYEFRGADNLYAKLLAFPQGEEWQSETGDNVAGELLRSALTDSALLPRLREGDRTLEYSVSSGVALLMDRVRTSCEYVDGLAAVQARGRDKIGQAMTGYMEAADSLKAVTDERQAIKQKLDSAGVGDNPPLSDDEREQLTKRLVMVEIAMTDMGINSGIREEVLGGIYRNLTLAGETGKTVRDQTEANEVRRRVMSKRETILKVEEAVRGVSTLQHLLNSYLMVKADLSGLIKMELGPEAQVATHVMGVISLSDHLNKATTIAMREMFRLVYKGGTESKLALPIFGEHEENLTTRRYTPSERTKFFKDWEECVEVELRERGIDEDTFRLASDAVSLTTVFTELFTMGGMAYTRDRITGRKISVDNEGGSGSFYDTGDVDTKDKTHQLRDRKSGEAMKGRAAPRPGVIKGLVQELQYNIFQYTEACFVDVNADGSITKTPLNKSILEAMTEEPVAGQREYTVRDMLWSLKDGALQLAMYFAFRAAQIGEKLDELTTGRINVIQELGGGPEKLVQDMIDSLLGLHKAWQIIPYGSGGVRPYWGSYDMDTDESGETERGKMRARYDRMKIIETQRNMINILSDFYRGAVAGHVTSGGYIDNPDFRGLVDLLPGRIYERVVLYTNVMTVQQYHLAILLAKSEQGGVLTEEMLEGDTPIARALRKILSQKRSDEAESLINVVLPGGYAAYSADERQRDRELTNLINESAAKAMGGRQMTDHMRRISGLTDHAERV